MSDKDSPIFIVGCAHSGTSLMVKVMGTHSRLCAIPFESEFAVRRPNPCPEWDRFFAHFDYYTERMGKSRWVDKTPIHITRLKVILDRFPNGKVVLMLRDGRDVAISYLARSGSLEAGIDRWLKDNKAGEPFWHHPRVRVVRYEDMVTDFEKTMRGVMAFVGEEYEEALERHHETTTYYASSRIVKPPNSFGGNLGLFRNWQINQPRFDGRGKWRSLQEDEKKLIKDMAGEVLIRYGYTTDLNW